MPHDEMDVGYSVYPTLFHALKGAILRTVRTWRYARSVGVDPTTWWGVYEHGEESCLASTGPLPGAKERAYKIEAALRAHRQRSKGMSDEPETDDLRILRMLAADAEAFEYDKAMTIDKQIEDKPHCDGLHHRWSYERPIRCLGCGKRFTDYP